MPDAGPRKPRTSHTMSRLQADLLLLMTAAIWGLAFVFQKTAMADIGPLTFIAARSMLAVIAIAPFAWYEVTRATTPADPSFAAVVALSGVLFFFGATLQQTGLVTATVSNTGFLTALYIVFVPLIAWSWHRVAPSPIVWPAAAVSFVGTWLLGGGSVGALSAGDMLVAVSALFWAAHVVSTGVAAHYGRPILFTCLQFIIVAVIALVGALLYETISWPAIWRAAPEIAYVGLLSSALTFTILTLAMRHTPPAEASVIVSTESLFGAMAGALLLGERLSLVAWTGAALIIVATLAIQIAPHFAAKAKPIGR
jgi:drug/metabolite transporter (DMT)-like permease